MKVRCLLLLAATATLPMSASAQTVEDRARAAAEASRAKTSDSDAIQENYLTPGLAGQPITTVDNSKTFNPNIACQKTATLLELIAQPGQLVARIHGAAVFAGDVLGGHVGRLKMKKTG